MEAYRARVSWPLWFHLIFAAAVLLCALGALPKGVGAWRILPLAIGACLLPVWWWMRFLHLEFSREGAAFGFGGPRRIVPKSRIRSAAPEDYSAARYMGWGYRIGWKARDRAYSVIGCRQGVRLRFLDDRDREWSVFLSCREPAAAVAALGSLP